MLALPRLCTRPVHRSRSGECVRSISVRLSAVRDANVPSVCSLGGRVHGALRTHAHELVSVLSDCHQRGHADQTEQLIPAIQKEILQAARADAVLCKDCKGEGSAGNFTGNTQRLQGRFGCRVLIWGKPSVPRAVFPRVS